MPIRNDDVDWDGWPVEDYLAENYRELHPCDAAVIAHHAAYYRTLPAGSLARTVEFGAGPNLYPLLSAAPVSRRIDAVETGSANVAYLRRQLAAGPDACWRRFHALCRRLDPRLPATLPEALAGVRVVHGDVRALPSGQYALASMHFVAEGASEDAEEFAAFCGHFARCVVPGGHLVAAFMENLPTYRIGAASRWPGCPVDGERVAEVFAPLTEELTVTRIDADPTLPAYGDTGMVLLTGRTRSRPGPGG
ncbi:class I SAM-dependent methyltransferase [Streptomyces sp. NPDC014806]|uniref:class I SAM-dependent methyltransferase n=1 Tax=Streptomyces sp. NPDC014806 TaxID=3364920 RepID=UPI0036FAF124